MPCCESQGAGFGTAAAINMYWQKARRTQNVNQYTYIHFLSLPRHMPKFGIHMAGEVALRWRVQRAGPCLEPRSLALLLLLLFLLLDLEQHLSNRGILVLHRLTS